MACRTRYAKEVTILMSMKFEIADWRIEVTWDGMLLQPLDRQQAKSAKKPTEPRRNTSAASRNAFGLAVPTFNNHTQRKGATK